MKKNRKTREVTKKSRIFHSPVFSTVALLSGEMTHAPCSGRNRTNAKTLYSSFNSQLMFDNTKKSLKQEEQKQLKRLIDNCFPPQMLISVETYFMTDWAEK